MDAELATLNSDIFRKIGRNLVMFQYFEGLLKEFITAQQASGFLSTFAATQEQRRAKIRKQTLGQLIHRYLDPPRTHADLFELESTDVTELWLALTMTLEGDQRLEESHDSLSIVLSERNDLVHHLLARWQPNSLESSKAVSTYLDQQYTNIMGIVQHFEEKARLFRDIRREFANIINDLEFLKQLLKSEEAE